MRKVPRRNYFIMVGLIILVISACFASYNLYNIYQNNLVSKSPLEDAKQVKYEDLKNATADLDTADTILIISYVNDKKVYNNEKEMKKLLKKKNLLDNVYYLNITEYQNDENFNDELNKVLKLEGKLKLKKLPAMIYYKNGEVVTKFDSKDHALNVGDIEQLIDMYDLAS